ncbi:hypothetical protein CDAR_422381 [Caerostris darwini]|uniref:Uncharacterized protein n=1 Tax=Caerostris darwini TaxID=1538125 RepID=A0AAV4X0W8_9ARAC|nr:hypothetical protein CDAR_422381 [Caerostris darwini]
MNPHFFQRPKIPRWFHLRSPSPKEKSHRAGDKLSANIGGVINNRRLPNVHNLHAKHFFVDRHRGANTGALVFSSKNTHPTLKNSVSEPFIKEVGVCFGSVSSRVSSGKYLSSSMIKRAYSESVITRKETGCFMRNCQ